MESEKVCVSQTQSLIMVCKTLTADEKHSLLNRNNLTRPIRTQLSQKQKAFSQFFLKFSKSTLNFEYFQKKRRPWSMIFFRNYALRKTWLDICPKSPISHDPLTSNMVNGFKNCCDLDNSTVIIFTDHFGGHWVEKSLFYSDAKPYNCLLKHWLLMRRILFL